MATKTKKKPKRKGQREKLPKIMLDGVEAELTFDPDRPQNYMHFRQEETTVRVKDGEEEIGYLSACVGGGIELHDEATNKTWTLGSKSLWNAFQRAIGGNAMLE